MPTFLSSLTFLTLGADQFETPPWIILGVCLIGVLLAYSTDEAQFLLLSEPEMYNESMSKTSSLTENPKKFYSKIHLIEKKKEKSSFFFLHQFLLNYLIEIPIICLLLKPCSQFCLYYKKKFELYWIALQLKRISTSKRHLFYLLEKKTLNLPINKNESEIDSYLDCKRCVGSAWPFMWEVSKVADKKIDCDGCECFPMSSYSYLDLLRNEEVQNAAIDAAKQWASGNHGPRMLGGNMKILRELEHVVAKFFGREDSLLCATGYLACMSACVAISTESTVIFADSRLHASLRAGLKIGEGKTIYFKHNNFKACEQHIKKQRSRYINAWMVIESVYSMDGDLCDLPAAYALCRKYNIQLIIDEAHGLGVIGATGRGVEEHFDLQGCATLIVGTFSKSIASIGGYITGPKRYIDYLDFHAPGNVFSAPLPAYCAGAAIKSFQLINEQPNLIKKVQCNSKLLRNLLKTGANLWPKDYPESKKYKIEGDEVTTVIPIVLKDDIDRVMRIATRLKQEGFMCSAVAYPACPLRFPRFRITATTAYTEELMLSFTKALVRICVEEEPSNIAQILL